MQGFLLLGFYLASAIMAMATTTHPSPVFGKTHRTGTRLRLTSQPSASRLRPRFFLEMNTPNIRKKIISELQAANISSTEIDAQILLEFVTGKSREFLLSHPEYELSGKEYKTLTICTDRRKSLEPIAYITGHKEFYGLNFEVDKNVLIPRPETELLVEMSLDFLKARSNKPTVILDIGTGSGNIITSIANTHQTETIVANQCRFFASDISSKALKIARGNADKHKVKIKFIQSDLFENISEKFDLIVANLPYVPLDGSDDLEIKYEPQNAIFANDNGKEIIINFIQKSEKHLKNKGLILIELDPRNAKSLAIFAAKLFANVEIVNDYSNKLRFLKISN
ncbi:MAG: peptide chain release factor N(5)-glutamine methyltransferase [Patescibacteria group bacterium]